MDFTRSLSSRSRALSDPYARRSYNVEQECVKASCFQSAVCRFASNGVGEENSDSSGYHDASGPAGPAGSSGSDRSDAERDYDEGPCTGFTPSRARAFLNLDSESFSGEESDVDAGLLPPPRPRPSSSSCVSCVGLELGSNQPSPMCARCYLLSDNDYSFEEFVQLRRQASPQLKPSRHEEPPLNAALSALCPALLGPTSLRREAPCGLRSSCDSPSSNSDGTPFDAASPRPRFRTVCSSPDTSPANQFCSDASSWRFRRRGGKGRHSQQREMAARSSRMVWHRARRLTTDTQSSTLQRAYELNRWPSRHERNFLARALGLSWTSARVNQWFRNRRKDQNHTHVALHRQRVSCSK